MIDYNSTIGLPVLVINSGKEIGKIKEFIINFETGRLIGMQLSEGILEKQRAIRIEDIKEIGQDAVMVSADSVALPLKGQTIFNDLLDKKIKIKNNTVITESGKELGNVSDFELDSISFRISKLYVHASFFKNLFKGKLIVDFSKIISIGRDAIVVSDDFVKEKQEEIAVPKIEQKEMISDVMMKDTE